MEDSDSKEIKNIGIRMSESMHRRAKTRLAEEGSSFQEFVVNSIDAFLRDGKPLPPRAQSPDEILASKLLAWVRHPHGKMHARLARMILEEVEGIK
jgi:hypothetical protein